jgi:hypothetical protein
MLMRDLGMISVETNALMKTRSAGEGKAANVQTPPKKMFG